MNGPDDDWEEANPVPLYVITGGRAQASDERLALDLVTLVVSRSTPEAGLTPEQAAIVRMCERPLSVAEISAYLALPFSAVGVLLADLLAAGQVDVREPRRTTRDIGEPDIEILKALIDGLQRL
jgi:hypothetical protein